MKKFYLVSVCKKVMIFILCFAGIGKVMATDVSGNQSGTWTLANSPYVITENVTVPNGQTLTIEPGVEVQFSNGNNTVSEFLVNGTLKAIGTPSDSIKFTGGGYTYGSQHGPITIASSSTNSEIRYTIVSDLGFYFTSNEAAVIYVYSSTCAISNCTFKNINASAILINSSSTTISSVSNNWFDVPSIHYYSILSDIDKLKYIKGNYSNSSDSVQIGLSHFYDMKQNDSLYFGYDYTIINNQTIELSKTLTVEPGVYLYFFNGNNTTSQLDVKGTLKAIGTSANFIYFTGSGSFDYGTHSQGYSYGSQQGPITIEKTSNTSIMQYITVDNLGYYFNGDETPAIIVSSNSCKIVNCSIINAAGYGAALQIDQCSPNISNNNFANSGLDVICDLDKVRYLKNNNALKIGLTKQADMGFNDTLTANNTFYKILTNQTVPQNKILNIEPSVEVQFTNGNSATSQLIVEGTLDAQGTSSSYISFTGGGFSYGSQRGPITIEASSINSVLKFISISELGYYFNNTTSTAVLLIKSSSCTVENCNITDNSAIAIIIENASPFLARNCIFTNVAGILLNGGKTNMSECNIVGNSGYGVKNTSSTDTVNAVNCFWGDASGPQDVVNNPGGSGDIVSGNVLYNPWATDQYDCSEAIALPLTLLNFKATLSGNAVTCNWQTASEVNTNYFMVQRSANGTNFSDIGKVYAAGNGNNSYQFTDKTPNPGANYYRLQMTDKDGRYTYSKVLPINLSLTASFVIYPNPAKDHLFVQVKRTAAEKAVVQITDMQGKVLQQQTQQLAAGTTSLSFTTSALANGTYILLIKGQKTEAKIFVKE